MIAKPRRGVLLLLVLSMLAMFAMFAVSFVVIAGSARKSADRVRPIDTAFVSPAKQLNSAADIIFRGQPNWPYSLLEEEYGSNNIPYGGYGYGYNPASGVLDAKDPATGLPLALLPRNSVNFNPPGGSNSDYTAPDNQHPLLAFELPGANGAVSVPIPSLHRADLIAYLTKQQGGPLPATILRQVMFRPNSLDHPNFTGSNPNFNPTWDGVTSGSPANGGGQWDVSNLGNGVPDSVWVDLGFPVSFTADGQAYKPLFAILCLDLDGRLNINAHGNLAQASANFNQPVSLPYAGGLSSGDTSLPQPQAILPQPQGAGNWFFAGGAPKAQLVRGQGGGPAEVNLSGLLGGSYQALLQGNGTQLGRYGGDGLAGTTANNGYTWLSWNRWFGYAENYWQGIASGMPLDAYGSPPDTQGFGAIGLDVAGHPLYISMGGSLKNMPYDSDLSPNAPYATGAITPDSPFSASEMERILRPYDRDAGSLPQRLVQLTGNTLLQHPSEVTMASFKVNCAPTAFLNGVANLPAEFSAGLKMNLNRPFGGGARSQGGAMAGGNTAVEPDQPGLGNESVGQYYSASKGTLSVGFSYGPAGTTNSLAARQLYARDLYTLMTAVADMKALGTRLGSAAAAQRFVAQWAVNCVAFRDHNSIMIPFLYDGTNTVWGCKRPDLLITEAIAYQDRRTQDLNTETVNPKKPGGYTTAGGYLPPNAGRTNPGLTTDSPPGADPGFNQMLRPKGSLFVELYMPWTALESQSRDLLVGAPPGTASGILLTQTSGANGASGSPVWRLIIIDPSNPANAVANGLIPDPDGLTPLVVERAVYFVPSTAATIPSDPTIPAGAIYTPSAVPGPLVVAPGQYAVIGSGEQTGPNQKQTLIGLNGSQSVTSRAGPYIDLTPGPGGVSAAQNGSVLQNTGAAAPQAPPVVLAIDTPARLSVSEPINGGYAPLETIAGATYNPATESYGGTPIDIPLDWYRDPASGLNGTEPGVSRYLNNDGTYPAFRIIYLQRLADPTQAYNSTSNPYRTIDAMPVDLTTFNGATTVKDPNNTPVTIHFEARQRGDNNAPAGEFNLWKQEPLVKSNWRSAAVNTTNASPFNAFANPPLSTLGFLNSAYGAPVTQAPYLGAPPSPFPWFNWAYRPFVNEYELLQVPCVSSSQLLMNNGNTAANQRSDYGYVDSVVGAGGAAALDIYTPQSATASPLANFPHLLNFFDSGPASQSAPIGASGLAAQFHRILAYVGVPTPFVHMSGSPYGIGIPWANVTKPWNREPGKINLNTLPSQLVFQAMGSHPLFSQAASYDKFLRSRLGTGLTTSASGSATGYLQINPNFPSRFMQPFRTPGGAVLSASLSPQYKTPAEPYEVDYTLLRRDPDNPKRPLFQADNVSTTTNSPPTDYNRNSYFRYQALQQLGGVASCHSNVFAVWITVGYFEVTSVPVDAGHPDGYQLGAELGSDTGDISRHRAFYIFDRSIPLPGPFARGVDTNQQSNCLLVSRFIE